MISHPAFSEIDPWSVRERHLDLTILEQSESVFALSNGHIGLRANLDEGDPHGMPGTYLNAFYETRHLPYPESGYGYPETAESLVNVTNGKILRLLVNDEPFDVRYGTLHSHRRVLDLRTGVLRREVDWASPTGHRVRIRSTRLVSFRQRAVAAFQYEVEPVDAPCRVVLQSELVANEALPSSGSDPRSAGTAGATLRSEFSDRRGAKAVLVHSTALSGLRVASAMDHVVRGPAGTRTTSEVDPDLGRVTVTSELRRHRPLRLVKFVAYGWSSQRSVPALRDQAEGALAEAVRTGWAGLVRQQRDYLSEFWRRADVEVDGDDELQQALRFGLFQALQASARAEGRPIPAKGLTGSGYEGHTFWDMDTFVLHALTYTMPSLVPHALRWRHSILPQARERAKLLGLRGAAFPWRTIGGPECSGYWPAGTAAFHINADIADAVVRYGDAVPDREFEREFGVELLAETARLWSSLGVFDVRGRFHLNGVTGPNEYSALADNNVYTNLMAQQNLRAAAAAVRRHPDRARELGVRPDEPGEWIRCADAMTVPFDRRLGLHPQSERFTEHERWDFDHTPSDQYPLLLNFHYFQLYRKQVVKQADLVLALHLRGDAFTAEQKRRAFDYYEGLTVRDSSLSACTQAVVAAEVGHVDLAYDYLAESALVDLHDVNHNVRDGLHVGSLAGSWIAAVEGLGGLRFIDGVPHFAPRLPTGIRRLSFRVTFRGSLVRVVVRRRTAQYRLLDGPPIVAWHHGRTVRVGRRLVSARIPTAPRLPRPAQPKGREPLRRAPTASTRTHRPDARTHRPSAAPGAGQTDG